MGIANAVAYLYTAFSGLLSIHIYIQPGNIILDENNVAKLIDFSLSMSIPEGQLHVQVFHIRGKHGYAMPEYARMGYLIENADAYRFGVLIPTLLAGRGSCLYGEYDMRLII